VKFVCVFKGSGDDTKLWASPPACLLTVLSISDLAPSNTTVSKKNVELLVDFVLYFCLSFISLRRVSL
jgi:hypothetical protein